MSTTKIPVSKHMVSLWENDSPSASFAASTKVTLSESVEHFDLWMLECNLGSSLGNQRVFSFYRGQQGGSPNAAMGAAASNTNGSLSRGFTMSSATEIVFAAAYSYSSIANDRMIPVAVYGINF